MLTNLKQDYAWRPYKKGKCIQTFTEGTLWNGHMMNKTEIRLVQLQAKEYQGSLATVGRQKEARKNSTQSLKGAMALLTSWSGALNCLSLSFACQVIRSLSHVWLYNVSYTIHVDIYLFYISDEFLESSALY